MAKTEQFTAAQLNVINSALALLECEKDADDHLHDDVRPDVLRRTRERTWALLAGAAGASQPAHPKQAVWHADVARWIDELNHWDWPDDLPHKPSPPNMTVNEERMAVRGAFAALEAVAALAGVEVAPTDTEEADHG